MRPTLALAVVLLAQGCIFRSVAEQQARLDSVCTIRGHVSAEASDAHPILVGLVDAARASGTGLIDHFVLERAGEFAFFTSAGSYGLGAFQSLDDDLQYDPGEPALAVDRARPIQCEQGQTLSGIRLLIPRDGRLQTDVPIDLTTLEARSTFEQERRTLGRMLARGQVTTLADPRFAREKAESGLWKPLDFILELGAGVYFLQPYDPDRIPVLFVHGMVGTPRDFEVLIAKLDRTRFQPWVFHYPSGASLDTVVGALSQVYAGLRVEHEFSRMLVVAHSMGGLVSRAFLLQQSTDIESGRIPLFVSLATPWLGQPSASAGVEHAPAVVRSWYAMAPNSAFQRALFFQDPETMRVRRSLPKGTVHHLFFGFHREESWPGASGDSTIALVSQLRPEAQADALRLHGHDATHTGILRSLAVSAELNEVLSGVR